MPIEWAEYFDYPRYPLVVPPLAAGVETKRHRVAIIGAGPIGLTLALELANYEVASLVLEADDTVCLGSRATCISRRSLEILERVGAERPFLAKGLGWTGGRSYYGNSEVFRLQMRHDENQKSPPMINLQQCYTEKFLLDAVHARSDLIEVRWQTWPLPVRHCRQCPQMMWPSAVTSSPGLKSSWTSLPTSTISPANSWPSVTGGLTRPWAQGFQSAIWRSVPQTPAWCTRISTSDGPHVGFGTSRTVSPGPRTALTIAFIAPRKAEEVRQYCGGSRRPRQELRR